MKSTLTTMTLSLTLIAASMGAALGLVHDLTAQPIAQAETKARTEALMQVLPNVEGMEISEPQAITLPGDAQPVEVYCAYAGGKLSGVAVETWTMDGFAGEIRVMAGFDAEGRVSGYRVLQSSETPGLGSKADTWFASDAPADAATGATSHGTSRSIIGTTEPLRVSKDGGTVDGITAATITSRAFLRAINRARQAFEAVTNHQNSSQQ